MDIKVILHYKVVVALALVVIGTIFAVKMDSTSTKEVSIHLIDAVKESMIT